MWHVQRASQYDGRCLFKMIFVCVRTKSHKIMLTLQPWERRKDPKAGCEHEYPVHGVVRRGLYAYQLQWWLHFFKPEQMLVINHEELQRDPEAILDRAIVFLGLNLNEKKPKAVSGDGPLPLSKRNCPSS